MKIPMREKYVDEAVGTFMIFGERDDGTCDVNDGVRDVFEGLPRDVAQKVVDAQAHFRDELYELLCAAEGEKK